MESENLIHDVAKEIHVEPHVLRYWEEELNLHIARNERGHRVYSKDDMEKISYIKYLKEQGLRLKAIKEWMETGDHDTMEMKSNVIPIRIGYIDTYGQNTNARKVINEEKREEENRNTAMIEIKEKKIPIANTVHSEFKMQDTTNNQGINERKFEIMQEIFQKIFTNIIVSNNNSLIENITDNIKNEVKAMIQNETNTILRQQGDMEERRTEFETKLIENTLKKQEEHFEKIDQILREKRIKNHKSKGIKQITKII